MISRAAYLFNRLEKKCYKWLIYAYMQPECSKSSIYYAVLLKKKLVILNDKLIRNIQNNIQVSSLNQVLIVLLIKMGIEGTFDTNELKFHLPRTLCISLIRFTPNTIICIISSKRAFVSLLSLFWA